MRDRARQIGEKAIEIFTGDSEEFGELRRLIETVEDGRISDKTTYTKVEDDLDSLLDNEAGDPDFPFDYDLIAENVSGLDRETWVYYLPDLKLVRQLSVVFLRHPTSSRVSRLCIGQTRNPHQRLSSYYSVVLWVDTGRND